MQPSSEESPKPVPVRLYLDSSSDRDNGAKKWTRPTLANLVTLLFLIYLSMLIGQMVQKWQRERKASKLIQLNVDATGSTTLHNRQSGGADCKKPFDANEFIDREFQHIVGNEEIKSTLKSFAKSVKMDQLRLRSQMQIKSCAKQEVLENEAQYLDHAMLVGPPGTGKTSIAKIIAKLMYNIGRTKSPKFVYVACATDMQGEYMGQTVGKVDRIVDSAERGTLLIDEIYTLRKSERRSSYTDEVIDTIMKNMLPPRALFLFCGYKPEMQAFLKQNPGLARRIPYTFEFHPYTNRELVEILKKMCEKQGEIIDDDVEIQVYQTLEQDPQMQLIAEEQNAGAVENWLARAKLERDNELTEDQIAQDPHCMYRLRASHFTVAAEKICASSIAERPPAIRQQEQQLYQVPPFVFFR